jgi:shikimate kinase
MNLILIGFMGVGKSEVGKLLASRLGLTFTDCDALIEEQEGQIISAIFSSQGEEHFRDLETRLLESLAGQDGLLLSTGGGMVLRAENVKLLKKMGPLVLLTAREEVILNRLKDTEDRPLLKGDKAQSVKEILSKRDPVYNKVADLKVDTSDLTPEKAVEEIVKWLKK